MSDIFSRAPIWIFKNDDHQKKILSFFSQSTGLSICVKCSELFASWELELKLTSTIKICIFFPLTNKNIFQKLRKTDFWIRFEFDLFILLQQTNVGLLQIVPEETMLRRELITVKSGIGVFWQKFFRSYSSFANPIPNISNSELTWVWIGGRKFSQIKYYKNSERYD